MLALLVDDHVDDEQKKKLKLVAGDELILLLVVLEAERWSREACVVLLLKHCLDVLFIARLVVVVMYWCYARYVKSSRVESSE